MSTRFECYAITKVTKKLNQVVANDKCRPNICVIVFCNFFIRVTTLQTLKNAIIGNVFKHKKKLNDSNTACRQKQCAVRENADTFLLALVLLYFFFLKIFSKSEIRTKIYFSGQGSAQYQFVFPKLISGHSQANFISINMVHSELTIIGSFFGFSKVISGKIIDQIVQ